MTAANGFNPMRHQCDRDGCFNIKHRAKIEAFAPLLPGKCAFGDVDAVAEVKGRFLFLEFKGGPRRDLQTGQRLLFERMTALSDRITVVVVNGDAESMDVRGCLVIHRGQLGKWENCDLDGLKGRIQTWAAKAVAANDAAPKSRAA